MVSCFLFTWVSQTIPSSLVGTKPMLSEVGKLLHVCDACTSYCAVFCVTIILIFFQSDYFKYISSRSSETQVLSSKVLSALLNSQI